jgi:hypothetical protein
MAFSGCWGLPGLARCPVSARPRTASTGSSMAGPHTARRARARSWTRQIQGSPLGLIRREADGKMPDGHATPAPECTHQRMVEAHRAGWQVPAHANGNAAIDQRITGERADHGILSADPRAVPRERRIDPAVEATIQVGGTTGRLDAVSRPAHNLGRGGPAAACHRGGGRRPLHDGPLTARRQPEAPLPSWPTVLEDGDTPPNRQASARSAARRGTTQVIRSIEFAYEPGGLRCWHAPCSAQRPRVRPCPSTTGS